MRREDLHKLLGGYAAGTLTDEERRALLDAALKDQALFDALAQEEPLRDALADPRCREQVLAALAPPRVAAWWRRPQAWALAGSLAAACVIAVVAVNIGRKPVSAPPQVAALRAPRPDIEPPSQSARVEVPAAVSRRAFLPPAAVMKKGEPVPVTPPPPTVAAKPGEPASSVIVAQPASAPPPAPPPPPVIAAMPPASAPSGSAGRADKLEAQAESTPTRAKELFYQNRPALAQNARAFDRKAQKTAVAKEKDVEQDQELGLRYSLVRRTADGRVTEVPLDTLLPSGESAHLRLEANQPGYLYVIADRGALFSGPVQPHRPAEVSVGAGTLHLILLRGPDPGPLATLVARTRRQIATQQLNVERGAANYAVNSWTGADAAVLADVVVNIR